jgi:ribose-phosphate pyrophosphokinase
MEIVKDFYKKIVYPDGDFYIELIEPKIDFTFRINAPEDLWELVHLVDVLNNNNVKPIITIPNLLSAQADKRFKENQSFGYKLIHEFLGGLNANFKIFHPHQEMCSLLKNVKIIDNSEFIKNVIFEHHNGPSGLRDWDNEDVTENLIILLPDGGAYKWGVKLADTIGWKGGVLAAAKNRKFVDGKSTLTQQLPDYDFTDKDVLIIDDCAIYGGSHIGLAKLLKEKEARNLYLAVSHLTVRNFENNNLFEAFKKVFTTNSKYDCYYVRKDGSGGVEPKNLEIIKIFK